MDEFIRIALTGTSQTGGTAVAVEEPLESLLIGVAAGDVEDAFLLRAGLRTVFRQAGRLGDVAPPAIEPAPPDEWPCGSTRLAGLLQNAFATDSKELLVEFLQQMMGSRLLLPHDLLPTALGMTDANVREHLLPVLGERGQWLSRFHPDWSWVREGVETLSSRDCQSLQREWDEGTIRERAGVLATLRRSDPEEARGWLEAAFAGEKADHRARLLSTLEHGLSADDEAFLETCLDDRSTQVKDVAAGLLARLPESDLSGRMLERADAMLAAEKKGMLRKKLKLTCEPPEQIDRTWQRDGIASKPPSGTGKRAFWAAAVLSAVAPSHWSQRFEANPAALIAAVEDDPFEAAVLAGWTRAATWFAAVDEETTAWLVPLWECWAGKAGRMQGKGREGAYAQLQTLLPVMNRADAEAAVLKLIQKADRDTDVLALLAMLPRPWSAEFAGTFLNQARKVLKSSDSNASYQWANALFTAAKAVPSETFAAALAPWEVKEGRQSAWHTQAATRETDRFCETIRMRQSFYEELRA